MKSVNRFVTGCLLYKWARLTSFCGGLIDRCRGKRQATTKFSIVKHWVLKNIAPRDDDNYMP